MSESTSWRGIALLALIGVVIAPVALKFLDGAYIWIFGSWTVLALVGLRFADHSNLQALLLNVAAALFVLGAAEAFFWMQNRFADEKSTSPQFSERLEGAYAQQGGYFDRSDQLLGYAPIKGIVADSRKYYGDELVYDVTYTIDQEGLRISPPVRQDATECLLFFGGSFTVGEGVNDQETLPYRVGMLTNGEYQVYNFGFHGYGPHQMLAALESGMVSRIVRCQPRHVIYQALDRHVLRSAGLVEWDRTGPRYVLAEDGKVERAGSFEDRPPSTRAGDAFARQLVKSSIYVKIVGSSQSNLVNDEQIRVFGGIVEASRARVAAMYPEAEFDVLLWSFDSPLTKRVIEELSSRHIPVNSVSDTLPDTDYRKVYAIGPHDHHPSAKAYDLLAHYVVDEVINKLGVHRCPD